MQFIQLRAYDNYIQANIQLAMLQSEGINCHLKDEYTTTIDPLLSNAIGGMKLMVFSSQAERAMDLLKDTEEPDPDAADLSVAGPEHQGRQEGSTQAPASFWQRLQVALSRGFDRGH